MTKSLLSVRNLGLLIFGISFLFITPKAWGQAEVTGIHTDWKGYWYSNTTTGTGNQPDTENNLLGFKWNNTTYSTGVNDATLTSKGVVFNAQKYRALKIQSLSYTGSTYFLQGSMIDGSATGRVLTPSLSGSTSTPAELASRLTDGTNGLALGTGIANIATNSVYFKVGTSNLNVSGLNDGVPDLIVTQVAQPGGTDDIFKFVDADGNLVGNSINISFSSVPAIGTYSLDLFNASNGAVASGFSAGETRDIRLLGYDTSAFGINSSNAALVDRFVVTFSGNSDCAFIAFNANSLKKAELSLVKTAVVSNCGAVGDKINYTFTVTNTGDVPVTNVTVTDPLPGIVITGTQNTTLAVGASATLYGTYTITAADGTTGYVTNSAKVTGIDPSLNTISDISGTATNNDIATVTNVLNTPTGTASQSFCAINLPTVANLSATGTAIKWYAASSGGAALATTTVLVNGTHYYASQTVSGCESSRFDVTVSISNSSAPTGSASQSFCASGSPTVANLVATGTAIKWYAASSGGTALATTTALVNATHYYASQTLNGCEGTSRFDVTTTVNNPSTPTGSASQTFCASGSPTVANLVATGTAIKWYAASSGGTALTTATALVNGTHYYATQTLNGCEGTSRFDVIVTVTPIITTPTVGTIMQPDCAVSTGSVVLSGLPASGTINQTGTVTASYAITGTTMTISGLTSGTYNFTASIGSCSSPSTINVVINSVVSNTWNGTTWSTGATPKSSEAAIINGNYSIASNGDLNVCSLTIKSGITLTVESGKVLIIQNDLTTNGTLNILNNGSLVMVNDSGVVNNNTTKVHRITTPYKKNDYIYWSTPITTSTIATTFTGWKTNYAYEYTDDWKPASIMTPGKGYIIMVPNPKVTCEVSEVIFTGKVNNGVQKITGVVPDSSYLLGNPYPSALDADQFIVKNKGVLDGTLYFWTHNTAIQLASGITNGTAGTGIYAYTSDDYATYNLTGGTATETAAKTGGQIPSGAIASGQGFFATSNLTITGTNEIIFNNSMRMSGGTQLDNSQFFKSNSVNKTADVIEKNRVWLNFSNDQGAFKQTLVGYISGATNNIDGLYDGITMDGNDFIDFYSVNQDKNLVIQGRALPFDENDEVPLGYKTAIEGTFAISIEQVDGLFTNQSVFLKDKLTNTEVDLKAGDYSFYTEKGTFNDRFVLKYVGKTLSNGDFNQETNKVLVAVNNKQIKINSFVEPIAKVVIYDLQGRQVYQKDTINNKEFSITNLASSDQVLIIKTTLQNGTTSTDKIVY